MRSTGIYNLSLHDALPICERDLLRLARPGEDHASSSARSSRTSAAPPQDRKSTRLNSSHVRSSYAVFCLKKKTSDGAQIRQLSQVHRDPSSLILRAL